MLGRVARSHLHCPWRHAAARPRKERTQPPLRSLGHSGSTASSVEWCVPSDRAAAGQRRRLRARSVAQANERARRRVRLPLAAMSEEARMDQAPASLRLRLSDQRRPGSHSWRPGRSVPTRETARRRGELGQATTCCLRARAWGKGRERRPPARAVDVWRLRPRTRSCRSSTSPSRPVACPDATRRRPSRIGDRPAFAAAP
jgi:hypothetical protein